MDEHQKLTPNPAYSEELFNNGETVLYTESGAKAVYLNDTACMVWKLCKDGLTVGQIIAALEDAYPMQKDRICPDVLAACGLLLHHGVVNRSDV